MRRKLSGWIALLSSAIVLWLSFVQPATASNSLSSSDRRHILERLSFGTTSQQLQQVNQLGIESYIESQLNPESIDESEILEDYLGNLDLLKQEPIEVQKKVHLWRKKLNREELSSERQEKLNYEINQLMNQYFDATANAHLARAIYSNRQLQEIMVDFWFNHFNVLGEKGATKIWLDDYERQIRTHALGNFRDLLEVTAKHPAMLIYLDNRRNTAPNSPVGKKTKQGLNENYARELMELHTLGVDGGYTQDDVIALAKIFTGWGVDLLGKHGDESGFFFYQKRHDPEDKMFLSYSIPANGMAEGERALDILASHPATARFISYKLAQYFVTDRPPTGLVDALSREFTTSNGNIKQVLNVLIHSQEFNDPQYYKQKFKTPYQYIISLVRMGEIDQPNIKRIQGMLRQLSMPLYGCSAPTGYGNRQDDWLNSQAMLQRTSLATAIARGALSSERAIAQKRLSNFGELSANTERVIAKTPPKLRSALVLGSPEAMYR